MMLQPYPKGTSLGLGVRRKCVLPGMRMPGRLGEGASPDYIDGIVSLMEKIVFNLSYLVNYIASYWFTLRDVQSNLYINKNKTSSPYIRGISDRDVTILQRNKTFSKIRT